jgi:uncharacterized lipoprotein YmbA
MKRNAVYILVALMLVLLLAGCTNTNPGANYYAGRLGHAYDLSDTEGHRLAFADRIAQSHRAAYYLRNRLTRHVTAFAARLCAEALSSAGGMKLPAG